MTWDEVMSVSSVSSFKRHLQCSWVLVSPILTTSAKPTCSTESHSELSTVFCCDLCVKLFMYDGNRSHKPACFRVFIYDDDMMMMMTNTQRVCILGFTAV